MMIEISVHLCICALVAAVASIGQASAGSFGILDQRDPIDIESIASAMCDDKPGRERQISRLSTVSKLAEYFRQEVVGEDHKLAECNRRHRDALGLLNDVITTSNENVCSEAKLNLIEDFHNLYVSTHLSHEQSRKEEQRDIAPQLLRLFFMHYALEVDALCKRTLINNLEWDLKHKFGDEIGQRLFELERADGKERAAFGAVFKGALEKFTDLYSFEKFEDVMMIWDIIENSYLSQKVGAAESDVRDDFDPVTGEPVRLLVRIRSRGYLDKIKEHCHYNFKPIYKKLILPIIKLADLGYSNRGEQFEVELKELRSNEEVRRWYSVTQLCEAILPVKFYEDPSLEINDVVVISKWEAAELEKEANSRSADEDVRHPLEYEPETNSFNGIDQLDSVSSDESQKLVIGIKSNLSVRERISRRFIKQILLTVKTKLKSSFIGRIFFSVQNKVRDFTSGKSKPRFERKEVGGQIRKSFDQLDDLELMKVQAAATNLRASKARHGAKGIGTRRKIQRKGDIDAIAESRTQALSYKRTKSWSEIFALWGDALSALAPDHKTMIVYGLMIIGVILVAMFTALAGMFIGGMG